MYPNLLIGTPDYEISNTETNASKSPDAAPPVRSILSPASSTIFDVPANSIELSAGTVIVCAIFASPDEASTTFAVIVSLDEPSTFVTLNVRTIAVVEPGHV